MNRNIKDAEYDPTSAERVVQRRFCQFILDVRGLTF